MVYIQLILEFCLWVQILLLATKYYLHFASTEGFCMFLAKLEKYLQQLNTTSLGFGQLQPD